MPRRASRVPLAAEPARPHARRWRAERALARPVGAAHAAALARRHLLARRCPARTTARFASREATLAAAPQAAVLFVDTFNGTFERERLGRLRRCCRPRATRCTPSPRGAGGHVCCGRTYLSSRHGRRGARQGGELIDALLPFAQAGVAIVGLEPSCLLTLRDEALVLGLGDARARGRSRRCCSRSSSPARPRRGASRSPSAR
jgi:hypothetical protein